MIKAIETKYKGYRFRSRLEARWAIVFDELEIEWQYEPEGFKLSSGEWYLPDFRVKWGPFKAWVEIKGGLESEFEHFDSSVQTPLPYIGKQKTDTFANDVCKKGGQVYLFGDIPEPYTDDIMLQNQNMFSTSYQDGSWFSGAIVLREPKEGWFMPDFFGSDMCNRYGQYLMNGDEETSFIGQDPFKVWWPTEAYEKARSARFEHGETPR